MTFHFNISIYSTLKNEGYGSLITETVNANSLSAFVKEQMVYNDDVLPDLLNVFDKVTVGIKKSKG